MSIPTTPKSEITALLQRLLNPDDLGLAAGGRIRDIARFALGKKMVERAWVKDAEWVETDLLAAVLHYPTCWDTAAYPTLASALREIGAFKCQCEIAPIATALHPPAPGIWQEALQISELPLVDECLRNFSADSTEDNAVHVVLAVYAFIMERQAVVAKSPGECSLSGSDVVAPALSENDITWKCRALEAENALLKFEARATALDHQNLDAILSALEDPTHQAEEEAERAFHRNAALDEAANAVEQHDRTGREWVLGSLWDTLSREASARIRALRSPTPEAAS
jgi:hypothetical protein